MKYIVLMIGVLIVAALLSQNTSAHVLVIDQSKTKGSILHIVPDDDPIAGKEATLFFDTQQSIITDDSSVTLTIQNDAGEETIVETKIEGSLVTAKYVFPSQGAYDLRYVIASQGGKYVFEQTNRISRGVATQAASSERDAWAEAMLVGSGIALLLLGIICWNRRREIAQQSIF